MSRIDSQEKIRYLRRYRLNELEIVRLKEELERWHSQAEQVTAGIAHTGKGSGEDRLQRAVESMALLNSQLLEQLSYCVQLRRDIERAIDSIDDERLQLLLRYRYISCNLWKDICATFFSSKNDYADKYESYMRTIFRWHGEAINILNVIDCQ